MALSRRPSLERELQSFTRLDGIQWHISKLEFGYAIYTNPSKSYVQEASQEVERVS